jgi:hypothetical protein
MNTASMHTIEDKLEVLLDECLPIAPVKILVVNFYLQLNNYARAVAVKTTLFDFQLPMFF